MSHEHHKSKCGDPQNNIVQDNTCSNCGKQVKVSGNIVIKVATTATSDAYAYVQLREVRPHCIETSALILIKRTLALTNKHALTPVACSALCGGAVAGDDDVGSARHEKVQPTCHRGLAAAAGPQNNQRHSNYAEAR